ncbi:hypothetical protein DSL72_008613 [Monilinia vaccinii-corymbosi]|uniref:TERF2-interacting telomeric protein 1 Myb domain-containing protein n=1 Tax=Monilinia vaccinii-corymbosi TaxID=61207 RepID=A0A8A3PRM1_9HELO|nr:hypothetical protein DSL72_008613 [Monilinia vaccinii-corymbosi]
MESPAKVQKISADLNNVDREVDGDYPDSYGEAEEDDSIDDDENDDIVYQPGYDPDQELQQRRARLDLKLKSTFESIFEKYGKDFDGVGDEIDLLTGEILVDNGHLKAMQDERDAGDQKAGGNLLRALTAQPESITETSGDEYSVEEEGQGMEQGSHAHEKTDDQDNADAISDGGMEEDDMILRGYDEPNQGPLVAVAATTVLEPARNHVQDDLQYQRSLQSEEEKISFPTYNEILRSFGAEVAPQIVNIISRKQGQDDTHIEPAWIVPELPESEPRERPLLRAFIPEPEIERSPSPDMSESIWALPKGRGRPSKPRGTFRPRNLGNRALPSDRLHTSDYTASDSPRIRNTFTEEEDEMLIAKLAEAHDLGISFRTKSIWKDFESLNPRHSTAAWKARYRLKYLHLWSPEGPPSHGSRSSHHHESREDSESSVRSLLRSPYSVSSIQRPSRTRKPAQQGMNVVSWSEAVETIKYLDPRLHKDLAKDASVFDLTDVRPVDVDEDALNLRTSDLELSDKSDDEPELPAHIGSGVQRISPITVNPAYEFSDEEAEQNLSKPELKAKKSSLLKTPWPNKKARKTSSNRSEDGTSGDPRSHQRRVQKKLMSEEVDELSFGFGGEDVLLAFSLPRKNKQREPQSSIKRGEEQVAVPKMVAIPHLLSKERSSALGDPGEDDEFDELSAEWLQCFPVACPKKCIAKSEGVLVAGSPDAAKETTSIDPSDINQFPDVLIAGSSDAAKETSIDIFDINQLPETSTRSALEARKKCKMNRRFSSSAVIPSTSSQVETSPTVAVERNSQWRTQQRIDSVAHAPISPTSSHPASSLTPRPKRKFAVLDEKGNSFLSPSHQAEQETETPVSDVKDMRPRNIIDGDVTPTRKSPNKKRGGVFTPTHSEARKSRTPLLDYTTPTRREGMRKEKLRGASQSPGGTLRKCGKNGFSCQKAFCFQCEMRTKKMIE